MTRDETETILRNRRALTGQTYDDDMIDLWDEALAEWTYRETRDAMLHAARTERRVSIAQLIEHLPAPRPRPITEPCDLCGGDGLVRSDVHDPRYCRRTPDHPDCACSDYRPCRCSEGQRRQPTMRALVEHNARLRAINGDHPRPPEF